jgi:hypothetical protein
MATINIRAGFGGMQAATQRYLKTRSWLPAGFVHLYSSQTGLDQIVRLGPNGWKQTAGFGGWEITNRPRTVGMISLAAVPLCEGDLHILYDEFDGIEYRIKALTDCARGTARSNPGILVIDGIPGLPNDTWVINGVEFGDIVIRKNDMRRRRQDVTIHVVEYQPPKYETLRANALAKPRPKTVIYKVKKNDTPAKIAKARKCKWTDVQKLNKKGVIKTANQKLKAGIQIMVPK